MYGTYDIGSKIKNDNFSISIQQENEFIYYFRECTEETFERSIMADNGKILINPVEPVNKPKAITNHLFIHLKKPIIIAPQNPIKVFLKFPIEAGIFLLRNKKNHLIDIFTLQKPKYTLYGDPKNGVLCRYYESDIYHTIPEADPLFEGVMQLKIINNDVGWLELTKIVFNAYGMKLFYSDDLVAMKSEISLENSKIAETVFLNKPLQKNMKNSLEVYISKGFVQTSNSFVMEYGI
ncbi:DUF432 domain-containing protein [Thermodesulfobacteriota bacterium]